MSETLNRPHPLHDRIAYIRANAGQLSTKEMAARLGTTQGNVHKLAHRNGIKLPRPEAYDTRARCPACGHTFHRER